MKTAKFTRRNAERFCCTHPTPVPQCLPWTSLITCVQPVEEKWARAFPGTTSWFHQVPRKTRRAKERQSWLTFVALQESLLGKLGADWAFYTQAEGSEQPTKRQVRKGCIWDPSCAMCNIPTSHGSSSACWGQMPNIIDSQSCLCLWVSWETQLMIPKWGFCPIWSLRENPSSWNTAWHLMDGQWVDESKSKMDHWSVLLPQWVNNLPPMQETQVWTLGWEDPQEKEMAIHSGILAWRIPWTEEPGGLQYMGSACKESERLSD